MNYVRTLTNLKDRVHRELVKEATTVCCVGDRGIIEFNEELEYYIQDDGLHIKRKIVGIDCNTGLPVDSKDNLYNYRQFSLENLVEMHNLVVNYKSFKIKPDLFV